jgi:hypothetical protein
MPSSIFVQSDEGEPFPLSPQQRRLFRTVVGKAHASCLNVYQEFVVPAEITVAKLAAALETLARSFDILRIHMEPAADGAAVQRFSRTLHADIARVVDSLRLDGGDEWRPAVATLTACEIDLFGGLLYRAWVSGAPDASRIFLVLSHVISDGQTIRLVADALRKELLGTGPAERPASSFRAYCLDSDRVFSRDRIESAHRHWRDVFRVPYRPLRLRPASDSPLAYRAAMRHRFAEIDNQSFAATARRLGVSPFGLHTGLTHLVLRDAFGVEDIVINAFTHGRMTDDLAGVAGCLYSPVPVRLRDLPESDVGGYFQAVQRALKQAVAHQFMQYDRILDEFCPERDTGPGAFPLTSLAVNEWFGYAPPLPQGKSVSGRHAIYDLSAFTSVDEAGRRALDLVCASGIFSRADAEAFHRAYATRLALLDGPEPIAALSRDRGDCDWRPLLRGGETAPAPLPPSSQRGGWEALNAS